MPIGVFHIMTAIQEYNNFYRKNPRQWASISRDEMVFNYIAPYGKPETILEVGCGSGHLLSYILCRWPGIGCVGIDFSNVAIDLARKNAPKAQFACIDVMDYKPIELFDVILLSGVAEHFDDPIMKLMHIRQLMNRKGILYLEVPNCIAYPTSQQVEGYRRIRQGSRQMEWHLFRESWEKIIKKAGFRILESINGPQIYTEFIWILAYE
jgi:trans-aconitate methyltransferase